MSRLGPLAISPSRSSRLELSEYTPQYVALERWALRKLGRIDHEWRVARIGLVLFDLLRRRHKLNRRARDLLVLGAIVHDVGRSVDERTHPKLGARMVLRQKDLPLGRKLRYRLAYLTLYHRGTVPAAGDDALLLPGEDAWNMRMVLALLRAADALDSRRTRPPALGFSRRGRKLRIDARIDGGAKAEKIFRRRKKFKLLEKMLGCRVEMKLRDAREMAAA